MSRRIDYEKHNRSKLRPYKERSGTLEEWADRLIAQSPPVEVASRPRGYTVQEQIRAEAVRRLHKYTGASVAQIIATTYPNLEAWERERLARCVTQQLRGGEHD